MHTLALRQTATANTGWSAGNAAGVIKSWIVWPPEHLEGLTGEDVHNLNAVIEHADCGQHEDELPKPVAPLCRLGLGQGGERAAGGSCARGRLLRGANRAGGPQARHATAGGLGHRVHPQGGGNEQSLCRDGSQTRTERRHPQGGPDAETGRRAHRRGAGAHPDNRRQAA